MTLPPAYRRLAQAGGALLVLTSAWACAASAAVENLAATVLVPADMPSAARVLFDPGALAFSDVSFAALVAGRLVVSSSSIDLPTAARATATPWGAPLAAGVTAALAPRGRPVRASVSFAYLRIAETFDAHTVHGAESASDAVDAANGADAWQAAAAADDAISCSTDSGTTSRGGRCAP